MNLANQGRKFGGVFCKKRSYDRVGAMMQIARFRAGDHKWETKKVPVRHYKCQCGAYHLTSMVREKRVPVRMNRSFADRAIFHYPPLVEMAPAR